MCTDLFANAYRHHITTAIYKLYAHIHILFHSLTWFIHYERHNRHHKPNQTKSQQQQHANKHSVRAFVCSFVCSLVCSFAQLKKNQMIMAKWNFSRCTKVVMWIESHPICCLATKIYQWYEIFFPLSHFYELYLYIHIIFRIYSWGLINN